MSEGVAEYQKPGQEPYRIFLNEGTLKAMDPSFEGKPIFVGHRDIKTDKIEDEADGYVVKSFYNALDGKHWVEFLITSDRGHQALQKKWKLSNSYVPTGLGPAGLWHGVQYRHEVTCANYDHLALVDDPRYQSVVYTPEEFKAYNEGKQADLTKVQNSLDKLKETKPMFKLFKREKIENALDFAQTLVELPTSKKELTLEKVINELDKVYNMQGYANSDHMVKIGEDEMSVGDLVKKHMSMQNEMKEMASKGEEDPSEKKENEADDAEKAKKEKEAKEGADKKDNDLVELKKAKELADAKVKELEKEVEKSNFAKLDNASDKSHAPTVALGNLSGDMVARGKERYGS